jgi:hypothetical protein
VFGLIGFTAFFYRRYFVWGICLTLAVLSKETALLLPIVFSVVLFIFSIYGIVSKKHKFQWRHLFVFCSFIAFSGWLMFARSFGQGMWNDWIFITGERFGAIEAILHTIRTGALFNEYLKENLLHLFILNFQWILTTLAVFGCILGFRKSFLSKHPIDTNTRIGIFCMVSYFISYCLFVLSFQTYPIPRYTLPVEPYLLLAAGYCLVVLFRRKLFRIIISVGVGVLCIVRLFYSADPVSYGLWGSMTIGGETLYAMNEHLSGNDGTTYNGQFLTITGIRTRQLRFASKTHAPVVSSSCRWTFADVRNDIITLPSLGLTGIPDGEMCIEKTQEE